ncbi:isoflavone reductase like P3 [Apiospora kogelbergensis]|uniref:Isoflavone reductase like P3 n=1 Tax=Apiospora kogelbergensis TaxID=1337665 RepID=A0AAW0R7W9_9PEZI
MESRAGARLLAVDYNDVSRLTLVLEANKIEMVICTINPLGSFDPELNLIQAAEQSKCTKRFIPSAWGNKLTKEYVRYPSLARCVGDEEMQMVTTVGFRACPYFYLAPGKLSVLATLDATSLEWTAVHTGLFMDYWLMPKIKSYLSPMTFVVDLPHRAAAIPGSGHVPVVFTYSSDIARYVARLVGLPKWDKDSFIVGDKVTWNEFLGFAEEATGNTFTVVVDSMDKLESGHVSELPGHREMYASAPKDNLQAAWSGVCRLCEDGGFDFEASPSLAESFLDPKPRKVRESLLEAWRD